MTTPAASPVLPGERLAAVPAVVALAACAAATLALLLRPAASDPASILRQAEADFTAGRFETAVLRYEHVMALRPDDPAPAFRMALAMDRLGHRTEAMQVLALIAPAAGRGYAPAHLQQAEWLIEAHVLGGNDDRAALAAARGHLQGPFPDAASEARAAALRGVLETEPRVSAAVERGSPSTQAAPP